MADGERNGLPLVRLRDVWKVYGEKVQTVALREADLDVRYGEFSAIIGPSGSGKSTLLHLIGALDRPTKGTVLIDGRNPSELDDDGLARLRQEAIGFVFQFHFLLPDFTALENVLMPFSIAHDTPTKADTATAEELLVRVGLKDRMRNPATDLSGGQQQRVAIARALAFGKPLVLADEPTGNLDRRSGDEVIELMREINKEDGTAFLIVTHDPRLADRTDRIIEVLDGRIAADRPPASS